ncbi:MAG: alpha-hydroxy-acid oxidizing protein [Sphingomonas bacterium]|nr:alpha-hydroxy-acid oxidizing protein [Sphingomonas bacterium]
MSIAQFRGHPRRSHYTGPNLARALTIEDLRARAHRRMPRFVLEYLEGGAEDEATLARERAAQNEWRFVPRTLVDVSGRTPEHDILGVKAPMPLIVAPTGLNGVFCRGADVALATGAAAAGVPFAQSTMSNDTIEHVAAVEGLRHWFQLYIFGEDRIWHNLVDRAAAAGCEALVLTSNSQIFGNREWEDRTQVNGKPSLATIVDVATYPAWIARTLLHGMPVFSNVIDFVPKEHRGFFASATWIRQQMPKSLSWDTVTAIRKRWKGPFLLKGILSPIDAQIALDSGVDGIVVSSHGGRQMDWAVSALDVLPRIRDIAGDRMQVMMTGGIRRGTDILKAMALGADAVMAGRAPLYGLCAAGSAGAARALEILHKETCDAMGLLGVASLDALGPHLLAASGTMALPLDTKPTRRTA